MSQAKLVRDKYWNETAGQYEGTTNVTSDDLEELEKARQDPELEVIEEEGKKTVVNWTRPIDVPETLDAACEKYGELEVFKNFLYGWDLNCIKSPGRREIETRIGRKALSKTTVKDQTMKQLMSGEITPEQASEILADHGISL